MANTKVKSSLTKNPTKVKKELLESSIYDYKLVLNNLESGYAYQKIILDSKGNPTDFEYLEVNPAFEKLMGLKAKNIIGKRVTEVIPDFKKKKKDWIKFYGEIALTGKSKSVDFYSISRKKWLHINSHSHKKGYFISEFQDITKRKQAEILISESNTKLNNIIESISDAFVALDENWCYTYMNKRAGEIFGRDPKEIIGKHIWTEFPEGIGQSFHLNYERAFKEQIFIQMEEYYPPYDKWFENRIYPSKAGLSIFFQDITIRKKAEIEIKKVNRTYNFISQINQMIVREHNIDELYRKSCNIAVEFGKFRMAWIGLLDNNSNNVNPLYWAGNEDGYLLEINKINLKNTSTGNGPTAKSIKEGKYFYCNDIAKDPNYLLWKDEALKRGYRSSIALPLKLQNKIIGSFNLYSKYSDFFDDNEIRLLTSVSDDISYAIENIENEKIKKEAEDSLRENERFMSSIIENIPHMIFIKDAKDLKFLNLNKAGENLLGFKRHELIGKNDYDFFPKEQADFFTKMDKEVLKSKSLFTIAEESIDTKDGKRILHTKKIPIIDKSGKPEFLLGISEDITERKKAKDKLLESEIHYKTIFENTGTATVIIEEDTTISLANSKFEELSGYSKDEIENKIHWTEFVVKEDLEEMLKRHKTRRIDDSKVLKSYEFRFTDKMGKIKNVLITIDMIPGTKKSVASLLDITERNLTEKRIRESETRYRLLFEQNPVPMLIYERVSLKLISVNVAFLEHYGYSYEKVLTMTLPDLYPENQKVPIINLANKLKGHSNAGEWQHYKADGTLIDIIATSHDISFEEKDCRIAVIYDITERNKAEKAVKISEEKYRTLFETANDAIMLMSKEKFINCNKKTLELFRAKDNEIIGTHPADLSPKYQYDNTESIKKSSEYLEKAFNGIPQFFEWLHKRVDGTIFNAEVSLNNIFLEDQNIVQAIVRDITERKETEKKLLQNKQELDSIYNTVGDVIFLIQVEGEGKYRFSSVNKTFSDVTGLESSMVIGKLVNEVIPEPSLSLVLENYKKTIENKIITRWEETTEYPSGLRIGEVSVAPVFDIEGKCTYLVGSVHDISERKQIEERISKLNLELEDRVKIRTKQLEDSNNELEAFSYSVSHDLRAPLRAITGFSKLLLEEYYDKIEEEGKEYLDDIMTNSQRMANLIDDLLELSRYGRKKMDKSEINMRELFISIFDEEKRHYKCEKTVLKIFDFPNAFGDYSLMKQVAVNLISNAIKFSSKNQNPIIEIGSNLTEKECIYYIKDNGVGFNMKYVHKLFGVFQRLHSIEEYDGTGVGLAIVQRIINKHYGRVWAESEQGKGAVFYFALPMECE